MPAISNFNDSVPAAPSGVANVRWQADASSPRNVSAYLPNATALAPGAVSTVAQAFAGAKTFNNEVAVAGSFLNGPSMAGVILQGDTSATGYILSKIDVKVHDQANECRGRVNTMRITRTTADANIIIDGVGRGWDNFCYAGALSYENMALPAGDQNLRGQAKVFASEIYLQAAASNTYNFTNVAPLFNFVGTLVQVSSSCSVDTYAGLCITQPCGNGGSANKVSKGYGVWVQNLNDAAGTLNSANVAAIKIDGLSTYGRIGWNDSNINEQAGSGPNGGGILELFGHDRVQTASGTGLFVGGSGVNGGLGCASWTIYDGGSGAMVLDVEAHDMVLRKVSGSDLWWMDFLSDGNNISLFGGINNTSAARLHLVNGGIKFPDGTVQTTANAGSVTGMGTVGTIPKWSSSSALTDSILTDNGAGAIILSGSGQHFDAAGGYYIGGTQIATALGASYSGKSDLGNVGVVRCAQIDIVALADSNGLYFTDFQGDQADIGVGYGVANRFDFHLNDTPASPKQLLFWGGDNTNAFQMGTFRVQATNLEFTGAVSAQNGISVTGGGLTVGSGSPLNQGINAGSYQLSGVTVLLTSSSLNYGEFSGALILDNVSADPTTGSANIYLYSKGGQLYYRQPSSGTVIGPITAGGGISGSGTTGKIPKWSSSTGLTDSILSDNGAGAIVLSGGNHFDSAGGYYVGGTQVLDSSRNIGNVGNVIGSGYGSFAGSLSGYNAELNLALTTSTGQAAISTTGATGACFMLFDHRGTGNTGTWQWRNGTAAANVRMSLDASGNLSPSGGIFPAFISTGGSITTTSSISASSVINTNLYFSCNGVQGIGNATSPSGNNPAFADHFSFQDNFGNNWGLWFRGGILIGVTTY